MQTSWVNENPVVTIFGTGYMLYYCLLAAKELDTEGIQTLVVNSVTIKPLEEDFLQEKAQKTGAFVTVEDHQVMGGLGSAIAEWSVKNYPLPMEFIGLQNTFAESGKPIELIEKYGMGKDSIKDAVKRVLDRKK